MKKITDNDLLDELRRRFKENTQALLDLRTLTKKLEDVNKKLHSSEEMKSNFLSNIRNEINNPLASIMGLADNLISFDSIDKKNIKTISCMIHSEAFALDFQLRNIFAAAEIEAGEVEIGFSVIDISSMINNLIDTFTNNIKLKNITINFINELEDNKVSTDTDKINHILANLIDNAIEFSFENTEIEIKVWRKDGNINISVKDYGVKIDKSEINIIFDRFKQIDTGTTKDHKGHGLGLSVSKALLDFLNGNILITGDKNDECIITISIPEVETGFAIEGISDDSNEILFDKEEIF